MGIKGVATEKQKETLLGFGIEPPPTKSACFHLLSFIFEVNWKNMNKFEKAAFVKKMQWEWIGAKVVMRLDEGWDEANPGKVAYITINSHLREFIEDRQEGIIDNPFSLFRFFVISQDGKSRGLMAPSHIKRIDDDSQS